MINNPYYDAKRNVNTFENCTQEQVAQFNNAQGRKYIEVRSKEEMENKLQSCFIDKKTDTLWLNTMSRGIMQFQNWSETQVYPSKTSND